MTYDVDSRHVHMYNYDGWIWCTVLVPGTPFLPVLYVYSYMAQYTIYDWGIFELQGIDPLSQICDETWSFQSTLMMDNWQQWQMRICGTRIISTPVVYIYIQYDNTNKQNLYGERKTSALALRGTRSQ